MCDCVHKLVNNFKAVLVMFDESYPANNDMDAEFRRLAHDLRYSNEVFVAKMAVSTPSPRRAIVRSTSLPNNSSPKAKR